MSHLRSVLLFVCLLVICQSAGLVGVLVMDTGRSAWYRSLPKPALNPPGWVFGPVWTILYALMAVAAFLIIRRGGRGVRLAMTLFAVQLLLNASWTPVFFGLHKPAAALAVLIALWMALAATVIAFWRITRPAGWLLVPYLAWTSFALYLNAAIVAHL